MHPTRTLNASESLASTNAGAEQLRDQARTQKLHHYQEQLAGLASEMEGMPKAAIADLAGDFGLSVEAGFEAVDSMAGDGFAPEQRKEAPEGASID